MTPFVVLLQWLLALPVGLLLIYFSLETFMGWKALRREQEAQSTTRSATTAILIPAHNEGTIIGSTIGSLRPVAPSARILVVADNCSDETAAEARGAGAEVAERDDHILRGKGYALSFGRDVLSRDPPACVVVIDADCRIDAGGVDTLAREVIRSGGAVQAANLVLGEPTRSHQTAISNFAMMVKNLFRARGMMRIGGGAMLYGTGMAFPWRLFETLELATGDATEDISLGLALARSGVPVTLADHVRVTSPPPDPRNSRGQRTRWEHGFLKSMQIHALPLIARGLATSSRLQLAIGLHMLVPPLALLVALSLAILAIVVGLMIAGGSGAPVYALSGAFVCAGVALVGAWLAGGREVLPVTSVLAIPVYILWKIPIYLAYLVKPNSEWNRTRRDGENP